MIISINIINCELVRLVLVEMQVGYGILNRYWRDIINYNVNSEIPANICWIRIVLQFYWKMNVLFTIRNFWGLFDCSLHDISMGGVECKEKYFDAIFMQK